MSELRRLTAELVGTAFLVAAVVGSGIAAEHLSPGDVGLQLLENAAATAAALVAIIRAVGPVSGAHLNPVITLVDLASGGRDTRSAIGYVTAQAGGGVLGAVVANLMFSEPAIELSTTRRSSGGLWLAEVVATLGLVLVVVALARAGRREAAPYAVGAYIGAAYFFTASTSFANPAVTVARTLTDTFSGIEPSSAALFVVAQLVGGGAGLLLANFLYPQGAEATPVTVVPPTDPSSTEGADRNG